MMFLYNCLLGIVYPLLYLVSRFQRRLRENFALREHLPDFSAAAGKTHIWFHAASAGEFEQVRAVALAMRRRRKNLFFSFSFFSDSTYRAKKNDSVPDILFALPFDFPWRMARLVKMMQPAALVIGKYDAWPNQVLSARRAGIPVYLVSATLPVASLRYRWPLRRFLNGVYAPMQQIFAVNAEHADRLRKISPLNVSVAGDTRFDAIAERLRGTASKRAELAHAKRLVRGKIVLLGGSTYPTSEKMIVDYLRRRPAYQKKPVIAVIAPHHIREEKISALELMCQNNALKVNRLSLMERSACDVLIVDSLGILPFLYPLGTIAYVGGGFEGSVHSVIEAVAPGTPVITGPAILNSAEALELKSLGLLQTLATSDVSEFATLVENLCKKRLTLSRKLQKYFRERLGVSDEIVHTMMDDIFRD